MSTIFLFRGKKSNFLKKLVQIRNSKVLAPYFNYIEKKWNSLNNFKKGSLLIMLTWGGFFAFIFPRMLFRNELGIYAGWVNVWGDWSAHFAYAMPFAYRPIGEWFSSFPLLINHPFSYSFLADGITGLMIRFGFSEITAFWFSSLIFTLLMLWIIYKFFYFYFKSVKSSFLAITLFLMGGGWGFVFFLEDLKKGLANWSFFPREYTHIEVEGIRWINVITSEIIPQRSFALGLALTLFILFQWSLWKKIKFKNVSPIKIFGLGIVSGFMPIVHAHSLFALFICGVSFFLYDLRHWKKWILFALGSASSFALVYFFFRFGSNSESFFKWHLGWLANEKPFNGNILMFWLWNWGLFIPLSLLSIWKTRFYKEPLFLSGVTLFILSNLFLFQPWPWDNSKILTYAYLFFCLPIILWFSKLIKERKSVSVFIFSILFISLIFSGGLDLYRLTKTDKLQFQMWSNDDLKLVADFKAMSKPGDIVLTSDRHNHPITTHTGAQILMGYRGWLWTYGMEYGTVEKDVLAMYQGGKQAQTLFEKYNVKYAVIGLSEKKNFNINEKFFLDNYPLIIKSSEYKIFKLQ
ncbi:MAG: hypothetical protein WAV31_03195 [Candidatus Moraniibacteriota bacterium]